MKKVIREITKDQYDKAINEHDTTGIFTFQELQGYGVYNRSIYELEGKYYVSFYLGDSCD